MTAGLFAASSGIRANQSGLNVVSNNISNLNTLAFKTSRANFVSLFSQTISAGSAPQTDLGGTNPQQIGNGSTLGDISVNFNQGGQSYTGKSTDVMISGNGFFTTQEVDSNGTSSFKLTRAGNFSIDGEGNMVTSTGNRVMGSSVIDGGDPDRTKPIRLIDTMYIHKTSNTTTGEVSAVTIGDENTTVPTAGASESVVSQKVSVNNFSIQQDGALNIVLSNGDRITVADNPSVSPAVYRELKIYTAEGFNFTPSGAGSTTDGVLSNPDNVLYPEEIQLQIANVTNPTGLVAQGNSNYLIGANAGAVHLGSAARNGKGLVQSGALESSNVDMSNEFVAMILFQRGLEASSRAITVQNQALQTVMQIVQ